MSARHCYEETHPMSIIETIGGGLFVAFMIAFFVWVAWLALSR